MRGMVKGVGIEDERESEEERECIGERRREEE
jgi:hypothetical protein